jgi:hypothetical protein
MFDGTTDFVEGTFDILGPLDVSRRFTLKPDLPMDLASQRHRGRDIIRMYELGVVVLQVVKFAARFRHFVEKRPLPLHKDAVGLSSEIVAVEQVVREVMRLIPGQLVPHSYMWAGPLQVTWWGLFASTTPIELLRHAIDAQVVRLGEVYRAAHPEAFCDGGTWARKFQVHSKKFASIQSASASVAAPRPTAEQAPAKKRRRRGGGGVPGRSSGTSEGADDVLAAAASADTPSVKAAPPAAGGYGRDSGGGRHGRGGRGGRGRGRFDGAWRPPQ